MPFVCTRCQRDVETEGLFCPFCGTAAPQPDAAPGDPYVGRTIADKYFVNGLIGTGGMGQVYKATHITLDRPVALKMLSKSFLSDASMVQRFHREARAASKLNHPNCISIQDFGQTEDGALYIAMEYLPGRSLAKLLADEFPLGEVRVVRIVGQILAALAEAHAAGIIHRDLKLANVMVEARRDEPDFVKVLDFGIAKLSEPGAGGQLTGTGIVCGTPGYMSPEQARGEELDARSDLYAVGVILYELLTGRLPFESETPMGFVAKHMTEMPVPPSERRPDAGISAGLDDIVMRTLAKARGERPASAEELRELLFTCELSPEAAPPPSAPGHASTVVLHAMTPAPPAPPAPRPRPSPPPSAVRRSPPVRRVDVAGARPSGVHPAPISGSHPAEPTQQSGRYAAPPPATPGGGTVVTGGRTPAPRIPETVAGAGARTPPPPARAIAPTELTPAPRPSTPGPGTAPLAPRATGAAPADGAVAARRPEPRAARAGSSRIVLAAGGAAAVILLGAGSYALLRSDPVPVPPPEATVVALPPAAASSGASGPAASAPVVAPPVTPAAIPANAASAPPAPGVAPRSAPPGETAAPIAQAPAPPPPAAVAPRPPVVTRAPHAAAPRARKGSGAVEVVEGMQVLKVPPAASGKGILTITASPWATVALDGRELGETPREALVGEGTYRVRLSHPTLGTRETTVTVPAGRRTVHAANLSR